MEALQNPAEYWANLRLEAGHRTTSRPQHLGFVIDYTPLRY